MEVIEHENQPAGGVEVKTAKERTRKRTILQLIKYLGAAVPTVRPTDRNTQVDILENILEYVLTTQRAGRRVPAPILPSP